MKKYLILLLIAVFIFCKRGEDNTSRLVSEPQDKGHQHKLEVHRHQEMNISADKQKAWGIIVGTATKKKAAVKLTLPGVLNLNQNKTAHISSFIRGKVVSLSVDLGEKVQKGQTLVTINSPQFAQTQASFLEARARLNLSRKEYERAKMLLKEKAIEEKEYLRREAEFEKLSTECGGLGSILHSYGMDHEQTENLLEKFSSMEAGSKLCELANPNLPLLSPMKGTIIFRDVIVGEHIEPDKILFTVSDLNTLWATLDAYEKDLPYIHEKCSVIIKSSLYPEKEFSGKIDYISNIIDEKLRTIKIRIEVKNSDRQLKPNMYIQGIIENAEMAKNILAVPEEAIQNFNGEKIVFVQEESDLFAIRHVKLGEQIGKDRIIATGLKEGERIVIKGSFSLKSELTKETFGEAHVH